MDMIEEVYEQEYCIGNEVVVRVIKNDHDTFGTKGFGVLVLDVEDDAGEHLVKEILPFWDVNDLDLFEQGLKILSYAQEANDNGWDSEKKILAESIKTPGDDDGKEN